MAYKAFTKLDDLFKALATIISKRLLPSQKLNKATLADLKGLSLLFYALLATTGS